jgi:replicative DNA helicase
MGKTALALLIAQTNALAGKKVGVVSMEMTTMQLVKRFLAMSNDKLTVQKIQRGALTPDNWQEVVVSVGQVEHLPVWIADEGTLTIQELRRKVQDLARKTGVDVVIVDYLQLMASTDKHENRNTALSDMTRDMKLLAKELNICVVCLSQLSRECERRPDKRPILSDLRDSGAIEQDADVVMMLYRPAVYDEDADHGTAEILVRKNRNGPIGDQVVRWNAPQTLFLDT